jgi:hypothetical protein
LGMAGPSGKKTVRLSASAAGLHSENVERVDA